MENIFKKTYIIVAFFLSHISIYGQNSLPTSGPVVINNTLTVMGGTAFGSTVGMTNNYFLYWNDAGGTARRIIGLTPSNNVHLGDVDNILNGSNIFQTKNNHSFYNNGNYTFGINSIGQTYFSNNVWHASIDGIKRFYYELNGNTYFGTNSSYVFRNSLDKDIAFFTPQGSMSIAANQANGDAYLEVGTFKTTNGNSYVDLVGDATYTDYGLRLIRANGGANTDSYLQNRGTGTLNIESVDAGGINLRTNGNNRLYINSTGNIGIGTTAPVYKLDVVGNNFFMGAHSNTEIPTYLNVVSGVSANAMINFGFYNTFDATIWRIGRNGTDQSFRISNWASGTESNSITAAFNGYVGVGTTNPAERLHVVGNVKIDGGVKYGDSFTRTETRNNAGLQGNSGAMSGFYQAHSPRNFPTGANSWWHLLDVRHSNPDNNYAMQFAGSFFDQKLWFRKTNNDSTQAWSQILTYNPVANSSAIGEDAAGYGNFEVFNNGVGNADLADKSYFALHRGGQVAWQLGLKNNDFIIAKGSGAGTKSLFPAKYFTIQENGNVGINTTTPSEKLTIFHEGAGSTFGVVGIDVNTFVTGSNAANSYYFRVRDIGAGNNIPFIIKGDGKIGIGTTTIPADYKLAVAGNVIAEKVKVKKSNTWPDFVFSPSYKLPNLTEVENFVKQNSHLPEIPSAAEIEKDGQDLGEMNRLLLKKVEELTLYLIEQNKEIKFLKSKVELLEKK